MTQDEMLKELDVSHDQLYQLLTKFRSFLGSLPPKERAVIERSLPTLQEAMAAFGHEVTEEQLMKLFKDDKEQGPFILCFPLLKRKSRK